jgi:dihydroorotase
MIIEGTLVTHEKTFHSQVQIEEKTGLIVAVGDNLGKADFTFDNNHRIFPGFIDLHVHCREDPSQKQSYKEDFLTASQAAINGGVTAMMDMPNNPKAPVSDKSYKAKKELTHKALIDVLLYAGIGPKTSPLSFPVPYKAYMGPSVGDLFFDKDEKIDKVIPMYKNSWIAFHCESADLLKEYEKESTHERQRPQICEVNAIKHAINVCKEHNIRMNVAHLSTKEGLQKVLDAKKLGQDVTAEVCQHHLYFDEENKVETHNPKFMQMNPPLRKGDDRAYLLEQLKLGNVDYLATDHAPHTLEENQEGISGLPLLDTYGLFITWLLEEGVPEQIITKVCSYNPGKIFSEFKDEKFGEIEEGFVGSLTVLNLAKKHTFKRDQVKSKAGWSPFENTTFPGSVAMTIVRGNVYGREE